MTTTTSHKRTALVAVALAATVAAPAWSATMTLNNVDAPGVGFNDPTPVTPVGGNAGTTLGEQRLIAYRKALELWGKTLRSSVTIVVRGSFARLNCTATGATLAQAGALQIFSSFPGAPLPGHWYGAALANSIAGEDLAPGPPDVPGEPEPKDDIQASFNGALGAPDCLPGTTWYYGLDNNAPTGQFDFLDTFMHEVSHGLGFQNFANEATGTTPLNLPDVYMANTLDLSNGRPWSSFNAAEIVASAIRQGQIVWGGPTVTANQSKVLEPYKGLRTGGTLVQDMDIGTATFGAVPTSANISALPIAIADDGVAAPNGGTTTDGCEPITTDVAGKAALIDRGLCAFAVKAKNAQLAGAAAVIIVNSLNRPADSMGGTDDTVTIPAVMIGTAEGAAIRAASPGVTGTIFVDATRRFGAAGGYVRLYAPTVVALGSSISHFDTIASPNALMEPFITSDLRSARNLDLTPSLMQDIGWKLESLKIGECDTGVPNALPNGELLHVGVEACAAGDPSQFGRCVARLALDARAAELLPQFGVLKILRCVRG